MTYLFTSRPAVRHDGKTGVIAPFNGVLFQGKLFMFRRWALPVSIAAALIESWLALTPARADGEGALLQRLLDDSNQAATITAPGAKTATTAAARTNPREALRLTPDRTEIIRLDADAASVVVTNPAHAQVMLETPRLLLVMPRAPGSTSLFVLDQNGETIYQRDILISGASKSYVRIRKSCAANDANCANNSYYYCPDGCYEVTTVPGGDTQAQVPDLAGAPATLGDPLAAPDVPPNARSRTEPAPLPVMEGETGLDTDELDEEMTP